MKHKVYLGHFGNIQKDKGLNISVVRIPPSPAEINTQDISVWLQDLSPSLSLLSRYKANQLTWEEFREEFLKEAKGKDFMETFAYVLALLKTTDVVLCCYCKAKDKHCHRFVLGELFQKAGYEVEEL